MDTYAKYAPTGFDAPGLRAGSIGFDGEDRAAWLVAPVGRNRDSSILESSNWATQLEVIELADTSGEDHEVHRFGHWAVGWLEIVIVRPGSRAAIEAEEIEGSLASYPVLSDEDFSAREDRDRRDTWAHMRIRDRISAIKAAHDRAGFELDCSWLSARFDDLYRVESAAGEAVFARLIEGLT